MKKEKIKYAELEALCEMIITRKNGNVKHYRYASIENGKVIELTAEQFFRLEKKIINAETEKILEQL